MSGSQRERYIARMVKKGHSRKAAESFASRKSFDDAPVPTNSAPVAVSALLAGVTLSDVHNRGLRQVGDQVDKDGEIIPQQNKGLRQLGGWSKPTQLRRVVTMANGRPTFQPRDMQVEFRED